jgi:hypothetical protein
MPPINGSLEGPFYEDVLISFATEDDQFAQLLGWELQHLRREIRMDLVEEWRIFAEVDFPPLAGHPGYAARVDASGWS